MPGHDDDDDLFADLYGDDEETKPSEVKEAPLPVPPPSVAPPLQTESVTENVAAPVQATEVSVKAHDPRLPPPAQSVEAQAPPPSHSYQQQQQQPQSLQMPPMPQAPEPQPQPSYNTKEDGKMFIGGLNWETTDESLRAYFEQYGPVTDCMVMRDGATGRSRGFGFLTFAEAKSVNEVVTKEHYLDGKIIDPKRAVPRDEQEKTAKMFVGGVPPDCNEEQFSAFFGQFGRVVDATLMMDKDTGRPRGFGFVTFDSGEAVERAMVTPFLQINNKTIEVKRATPKGNQDRGGAGRGAPTYNAGGGFGGGDSSNTNAYGGMTPAMMAQYYQRMQQWMAQMQAMGRGQAAQGMMGMNPMMNPMMMQQMQQMQQMQAGGQGGSPAGGYQAPGQQQHQQAYGGGGGGGGSASPYGNNNNNQQNEGQYDDGPSDHDRNSAPPPDAPLGPARDSGYRSRGGGGGNYNNNNNRGYQDRGHRGGGGYQDRGGRGGGGGGSGGRGRGGYRGASRYDPYSR